MSLSEGLAGGMVGGDVGLIAVSRRGAQLDLMASRRNRSRPADRKDRQGNRENSNDEAAQAQ